MLNKLFFKVKFRKNNEILRKLNILSVDGLCYNSTEDNMFVITHNNISIKYVNVSIKLGFFFLNTTLTLSILANALLFLI